MINRMHLRAGARGRAASLAIASLVVIGVGVLGSAATVDVLFEDMSPHLGQRFEVRLMDDGTGMMVARTLLGEIESDSFTLVFDNLSEGRSYRLEFAADANGNGFYDAPPADHAWRIFLPEISDGLQVGFRHSGPFDDLGWDELPMNEAPGETLRMVDGKILPDEYSRYQWDTETGIGLHWRTDELTVTFGIVSPGSGWVSIGFDPVSLMEGADYILAAVRGDALTIEDHFGTGRYSHGLDRQQNILEARGMESSGETVVEFTIPRESGDDEDRPLTSGPHVLLLGYHNSSDSFAVRHTARSTSSITLD